MQKKILWNVLLFVALQAIILGFSISYIEDPDSMRFALAVHEYDLSLLQPHFPGYAVYCLLAKVLYLVFNKLSLTFAFIGGLAIFSIFDMSRRVLRLSGSGAEILLLLIITAQPLILLTATRYMPDLLGAALVFICVINFVRSRDQRVILLSVFLSGLLAGVRLSNLPLILIPLLWAFYQSPQRVRLFLAGLSGVLIWLIPLVLLTGAQELVELAQRQSSGHFSEFGGTIGTIPNYGTRFLGMTQSLWADGLGAFWPGRSWLSLAPTIALLSLAYAAVRKFGAQGRQARRDVILVLSACVLYTLWIYFYQNVVYKPRHVLPLLPFLTLGLFYGANQLLESRHKYLRALPLLYAVIICCFSGVLAWQHRMPSAMAQATQELRALDAEQNATITLVSTELVCTFMRRQGIDVACLSVDPLQPGSLDISKIDQAVFVVGEQALITGGRPSHDTVYYHNPFVNRMWPQVVVRQFPATSSSAESR